MHRYILIGRLLLLLLLTLSLSYYTDYCSMSSFEHLEAEIARAADRRYTYLLYYVKIMLVRLLL